MYRTVLETPLHPLLVEVTTEGVSKASFVSQEESATISRVSALQREPTQYESIHLDSVKQWLDSYFSRKELNELEFDLSGVNGFHKQALEELSKTNVGDTLTYSELAARTGNPKASRAVGTAMAKNPLCLLIPCHRVLRSDGSLGGYSGYGALKTKQELLSHESLF